MKSDEIYNLAAQSHVKVSFDVPEYTVDIDALGVMKRLEAVWICGLNDTSQSETIPFHPYSLYEVAIQYGYWIVKEYRDAYNMYCCSDILFNNEFERRWESL